MSALVTFGESRASPSATTRTAWTSSSGGESFSRKPLAPTRSAENTYSSASKVVSMMTFGPLPGIAKMLRAASSPFIFGMRMSISTTSGWVRRTISVMPSPSSAVPTTVIPGWASNRASNPARIMDWSSTISTRTGWASPPVSETMGPTYRHEPCPTYPLPARLSCRRACPATETPGKGERMAPEVTLWSDAQRRSGTYRAGYGIRFAFARGSPARTSRAAQPRAPLGPRLPVHPARAAAGRRQPQRSGGAHAGVRGHRGDLGRRAADARDAAAGLELRQPLPPPVAGLGATSGPGDVPAAGPGPHGLDALDGRPAALAGSGLRDGAGLPRAADHVRGGRGLDGSGAGRHHPVGLVGLPTDAEPVAGEPAA